MVEEFPSNSNFSREDRTTPGTPPKPEAEKKIPQVTTGNVQRRKKPTGTRLKEFFFSGDAKGALGFVALTVLVPAVKGLISDSTSTLMDHLLYGETRPRSRSWRNERAAPYNYATTRPRPASPPWNSTPPWSAAPKRDVSDRGRAVHDFDEILLESRGEGEEVLNQLHEIIDQYGQVSVSDLYATVGINSSYTDNRYGWTSLQGANVSRMRDGSYLLNLPKPQTLD